MILETSSKRKTSLLERQSFPWQQQSLKTRWLLFALLLVASLGIGFMTYKWGVVPGALIMVAMVAVPIVYAVFAFPKFGVVILLIMSYFLFLSMRFGINFPFGTLMDGIQFFLLINLMLNFKKRPDWSIFKGPISIMIFVWIGYNLLEFVNPTAESRMAWVYTVRSVGVVMLMYFVFMYQINTIRFMKLMIKMWLLFALFAAAYAFRQENIGFTDGELAYLYSDPEIASLLFIDGHWRKYSIFSDPVAFSYNMVVVSVMAIGIISGGFIKKRWKVFGLAGAIGFYLLTMLYSGTRGAYVLVPACLLLFAVLNFNKQVLKFSLIGGSFIIILIFIPTSNPTIYRFQTAFKPSDDASFNVRKFNQKRIQPFIQTHPLGGGLGATGVWGKRFAPNSMLANFPPDSGYVRVAVEMGWLGLLIFCTLMFVVLKTGINNYFLIKDPELKAYCLGMTLVIFAYNVGNYPQEAIVQFPSNILFYLATAIINLTRKFDEQLQQQKAEEESKKLAAQAKQIKSLA